MNKSQKKYTQTFNILKQIEGIRVGNVVNIDNDGRVFIDFQGNQHGKVVARFTSSVKFEALRNAATLKQDVLLAFENNDPLRPIIIDTLSSLIDEVVQTKDLDLKIDDLKDVSIDGKNITFDAKEQIVLKCGKASIILTRVGKVIIRGSYILNRSSGVNKIKGGTVQIN